MTRKEKKALLDAAELIATECEYFSCSAIGFRGNPLRRDYGRFYDKKDCDGWGVGMSREDTFRRILLILWFREVGLEGIGLSE